jgi:1-acyl-sn-glycerol-3-phosphate acyltransferase
LTQVQTFLVGQGILSRVFYWLIRSLIKFFCRVYFRLGVYGRENIPRSGAFILAPIHRSNVDTPIVSVVTKRRLRFMGKDSLWKIKPIGAVLSALGGFPVTRGSADLEALKRCLEVLAFGEPLLRTCQLSLACQLFRSVLAAPKVSCLKVQKRSCQRSVQ